MHVAYNCFFPVHMDKYKCTRLYTLCGKCTNVCSSLCVHVHVQHVVEDTTSTYTYSIHVHIVYMYMYMYRNKLHPGE